MFYLYNIYLQFTQALDTNRKTGTGLCDISVQPKFSFLSKNFGWTADYLGSFKKLV